MSNQRRLKQNFNGLRIFLTWCHEKYAGKETQFTLTWRPHGLDDISHVVRKDRFDMYFYFDFKSDEFKPFEIEDFPKSLIEANAVEVVVCELPRLKAKL